MVIRLSPELEAALSERARRDGIAPEDLAIIALRNEFLAAAAPIEPQDEWERALLGAASDCGVSLSHSAVSSEGLYEQ